MPAIDMLNNIKAPRAYRIHCHAKHCKGNYKCLAMAWFRRRISDPSNATQTIENELSHCFIQYC